MALFFRERQGSSGTDFNVNVSVCESDAYGNPGQAIATVSRKSSLFTWTGWYSFGFSMEEDDAPTSKTIAIVVWQDGGDELNYVPWVYSAGLVPGAIARYSSDGGLTWLEHTGITRLVKVSKFYDPFVSITESGTLNSSTATEAVVTFTQEFNGTVGEGGGTNSGQHAGTTTDESGNVVISNKDLIASIVVDNSGSMGWNDRGKNKVVAANEIIDLISKNYPGRFLFDVVAFGKQDLGATTSQGGGQTYVGITLDPSSPTSASPNVDGSTPSLSDGVIASGFSGLFGGHTYVLQNVTCGNVILFDGSGTIDQSLGTYVTNNVQSVGPDFNPILFSIQPSGTGSESGSGDGTLATVAEVPSGGANVVRKPFSQGFQLATSGLTSGVSVGDSRIKTAMPGLFSVGEKVDLIDANGMISKLAVTDIGDSYVDVTPNSPISLSASGSSSGGFVQQSSSYAPVSIDPSALMTLLVVDKDAKTNTPIDFFVQTAKGGAIFWSFVPLVNWFAMDVTYADQAYMLETYSTDASGNPLPPASTVQYYIDTKPQWGSLSSDTNRITMKPPLLVKRGSDLIRLPSVTGMTVGDSVVMTSSSGAQYAGYTIAEVGDKTPYYVRILPPVAQDDFYLATFAAKHSPSSQATNEVLDIVVSGVDVSPLYAGRYGQGRLPGDPPTAELGESPDSYNQNPSKWVNGGSFEIPTIMQNGGSNAVAAIRVLPLTFDVALTETEINGNVSSVFDSQTLSDQELAQVQALENQYAELVAQQPQNVASLEFTDDNSSSSSEAIAGSANQASDYVLSPAGETQIGTDTKFSTFTPSVDFIPTSPYGVTVPEDLLGLSYDMSNMLEPNPYAMTGFLAHSYKVYPAIRVKTSSNTVTSRFILPEYPVYFESPVHLFCRPEIGKTIPFYGYCFHLGADGTSGRCGPQTAIMPGVHAAGGQTIRLDYVAYYRGKKLPSGTLRVKLLDSQRTREQIECNPWSVTPDLVSEIMPSTLAACQASSPTAPCPNPPASEMHFYKRTTDLNGNLKWAIDGLTTDSLPEVTYLDAYPDGNGGSGGGFYVDIVNGVASITVPASDVVTRLVVAAEFVCPDNQYISCYRTDNVWVKAPLEIIPLFPETADSTVGIQAPYEGNGKWSNPEDIWNPTKINLFASTAPFEIGAMLTAFGVPVSDNVSISISGSVHGKYNSGDNQKIDPNSPEGQQLTQTQNQLEQVVHQQGDNAPSAALALSANGPAIAASTLVQSYWPPTSVVPSSGKTINGIASGFMVGPHGQVTMHNLKDADGNITDELAGDSEDFKISATYQVPGARGTYEVKNAVSVEWVSAIQDQQLGKSYFIRMTAWYKGKESSGEGPYADGWDMFTVIADVPASKTRGFPPFDQQSVIDGLVGAGRIPQVGMEAYFSSIGPSQINPPNGIVRFSTQKPKDPITGAEIGEDDLIDGTAVGWAAANFSLSSFVGSPPEQVDIVVPSCLWPPCIKYNINGGLVLPDGTFGTYRGCLSEDVAGCCQVSEADAEAGAATGISPDCTVTSLEISWREPLMATMVCNGTTVGNSNAFDIVRDGVTKNEIWFVVTFSGKPLPIVARNNDVRDGTGSPMPMPVITDAYAYFLDQEWDSAGNLVKSTPFIDSGISLTDSSPKVSVCRTSFSMQSVAAVGISGSTFVNESHYHSCTTDDITGNGVTTGTFVSPMVVSDYDHVHQISGFVIGDAADQSGQTHVHEPMSVAITYLNPISDKILNVCFGGTVSYDASRSPTSRIMSFSACTQLQWFDHWGMTLQVTPPAETQTDVLVGNPGGTMLVTLSHVLNGINTPVQDGVRVSISAKLYQPIAVKNDQSPDSGAQTYDLSANQDQIPYAIMQVTANAFANGTLMGTKSSWNYLTLTAVPTIPFFGALTETPTTDSIYIADAISQISQVEGPSQLYDAIVLAADRINEWRLDNPSWASADKAIIVLSDGCNSLSNRTLNQVSARVGLLSGMGRNPFLGIMLFGSPAQGEVFLMEKMRSASGGAMLSVPIGCDQETVKEDVARLLSLGIASFNSGRYVGTVDIGGSQNSATAGGTFTQANVDVSLPAGASVTLSVRFSLDGNSWTSWTSPTSLSGPTSMRLPGTPCRYMQYAVNMQGNGQFQSPSMSRVSFTYLSPSVDTVFLQPIAISEADSEYANEVVVTRAGFVPQGASVEFGAVNSNSTNPSEYAREQQPWFSANERSIMLTRFNETTVTYDNSTFYAVNGQWPAGSAVNVYVMGPSQKDGVLVSTGYSTNPATGTVAFITRLETGSRVILDVIPDKVLRIAMRITNYSSAPVETEQLTVMFNKTKRVQTYSDGTIMRHPIGDDMNTSSSSSSSSSSLSSGIGA